MTPEKTSPVVHRTRRNFFKVGTKLAAATTAFMLAGTKSKQAAAAVCFMRGTHITTMNGERKIEDLSIGDTVPSMFGGRSRIQRIVSFSYRRKDSSQKWTREQMPVRIARSALGPNVPSADLFVTAKHAIYIDGVLVAAGMLLNGTTVTLHPAHESDMLEFFHIELENHDVIYAEGAPCESLLIADEVTGEVKFCVPVMRFNDGRSEIKSCLRSALSPWIDRRAKIDILMDHLAEHGVYNARPFSAAVTRME